MSESANKLNKPSAKNHLTNNSTKKTIKNIDPVI